jgi:hypothetical protein
MPSNADNAKGESPIGLIEVRLSRLHQLFNSLDPSPFVEQDLDQDAEDYIVGSAEQFPLFHPMKLIIYMPSDQFALAAREDIAGAIHNYFAYRIGETRRRLRSLLREGRTALAIGLAFLFVCMIAREIVAALRPGTASDIVAEGLAIIGWVAMWRPLEIFLYDWWPIRRRARLYSRLASIPVELQARDAPVPAPTPIGKAPAR